MEFKCLIFSKKKISFLSFIRHSMRPVRVRLIFNIDNLFPLPFAGIIAPPVNHIRTQRCPTKAMRTVWIMMKLYFQWDQPIFAEIKALDWLALFKIPEMQFAPIF